MAREPKPTRAQRRVRRATEPVAGVYGVQVEDALADSWISRFVCFAESADQARVRIRDAGFHKRKVMGLWTPARPPEQDLPPDIGPGDAHWYRSRLDDVGWTPWERLPADYRHQGVADFTSKSGRLRPIDTT